MNATFYAKKSEAYKSQGLSDGTKYQLDCMDCGSPLAIVWQVNEDFRFKDGSPFTYNYKALCPFCGGASVPQNIKGEIRLLEIVEEEEKEDGRIVEKHITKFHDVQFFDDDELCLISVSKPTKSV